MQYISHVSPYCAITNRTLWPIRPKPEHDELLTSWLVRLASHNGLKLQTFCSQMFGRDRSIWNRDTDKLADPELLHFLAEGTGASPERTRQTTLAAYEGWIYQTHNPNGNTPWILPLGIYHRLRKGRGVQYCPKCLESSKEAYFRRSWRVGFVVACPEHGVELLSSCLHCNAPVCFHRREMGFRSSLPDGNMRYCFNCNYDLAKANVQTLPSDEMKFHRYLADGLSNGWMIAPSGNPVYAHLYFEVLHQVMKLLMSRRSRQLGIVVSATANLPAVPVPAGHVELEHLGVEDRRRLLLQAKWLFEEWPERFVSVCRKNQIWSTWLLRDMQEGPFWFTSVVQRELSIRFAPFAADYNRQVKRYREKTKARFNSAAR